MRIHALPFRKIHIAILRMPMDFRKRRAGRLIEKKSTIRLHDPPVWTGQREGSLMIPFGSA
jgi:hypothetical protein